MNSFSQPNEPGQIYVGSEFDAVERSPWLTHQMEQPRDQAIGNNRLCGPSLGVSGNSSICHLPNNRGVREASPLVGKAKLPCIARKVGESGITTDDNPEIPRNHTPQIWQRCPNWKNASEHCHLQITYPYPCYTWPYWILKNWTRDGPRSFQLPSCPHGIGWQPRLRPALPSREAPSVERDWLVPTILVPTISASRHPNKAIIPAEMEYYVPTSRHIHSLIY